MANGWADHLSGFPNIGTFHVRFTEKDYSSWRTKRLAGFGFSAKETRQQADGC